MTFSHDPRGESYTRLTRVDGVVLGLPSVSRKFRLPHDLAHFAVERALDLPGGIFGCIAAGAVFSNMTVLSGRPRRDARARSTSVLRAARRSISLAESLVGVAHSAAETHRRLLLRDVREAWGILRAEPCPYAEADVRRVASILAELGGEWASSAEPLELRWPERLRAG
ncbi:hypothetical protein [Amycolatopsis sp. NPDC051903]|uniref:hypothetical protein n=1 Tax=Amycolatopsis sp. NPDC051903 TaxID=3363936 RepID=UPI0037A93FDD